jgi:hypothetical protein
MSRKPALRALAASAVMIGSQLCNPATARASVIVTDLTVMPAATVNGAMFTAGADIGGKAGKAFVALQDKNSDGVESGWNTQSSNPDLKVNNFIDIDDIATVQHGGNKYLRFVLDVSEPQDSTKKTISLDELKIMTSTAAKGTKLSSMSSPIATTIFDLDQGGDRSLMFTDQTNGKGKSDLTVDVPLPRNADDDMPVYLFSRFGDKAKAQGGSESWMPLASAAALPEPATLGVYGAVALVAGLTRRTRRPAV